MSTLYCGQMRKGWPFAMFRQLLGKLLQIKYLLLFRWLNGRVLTPIAASTGIKSFRSFSLGPSFRHPHWMALHWMELNLYPEFFLLIYPESCTYFRDVNNIEILILDPVE